jgi:hypothetical protein
LKCVKPSLLNLDVEVFDQLPPFADLALDLATQRRTVNAATFQRQRLVAVLYRLDRLRLVVTEVQDLVVTRDLKVHEFPSIVKTAEYLCDHAI